jgi:hypothetical protein
VKKHLSFFVNQAEKNNILVKEQLDAVPFAMNLTIDTQFQNNLFREEAPILRSSMDMHEPPRFDQERFKNLLLKMLEKKGLIPRKGEDETQNH